jgi:hypothetical protein
MSPPAIDGAEDLDISVELMLAALAAITGYQTTSIGQAACVWRSGGGIGLSAGEPSTDDSEAPTEPSTFCDNFVQHREDGISAHLLLSAKQ